MKISKEILKRYKENSFSMNDYMKTTDYFFNPRFHSSLEEDAKDNWGDKLDDNISKRDLEPLLDKIHHKIRLKEKNSRSNRLIEFYYAFSKVAAILLLPALVTIVWLSYSDYKNEGENRQWVEIHSPAGARTNFVLPDGSMGWLNSKSSVKYKSNFKNNRAVELTGEAWFDVEHDNRNEFIVQTPELHITVVGTQFNVMAYPNERNVEVILEQGKVWVDAINHSYKKELVPNQKIKFDKEGKKVELSSVDASLYTSWKDGILIFRNVTFEEIARRLERRYNANIILHSKELNDLVLRATFEDENLDEILKLISITEPIKYKIHKRKKLSNDSYSKTKVEIWMK